MLVSNSRSLQYSTLSTSHALNLRAGPGSPPAGDCTALREKDGVSALTSTSQARTLARVQGSIAETVLSVSDGPHHCYMHAFLAVTAATNIHARWSCPRLRTNRRASSSLLRRQERSMKPATQETPDFTAPRKREQYMIVDHGTTDVFSRAEGEWFETGTAGLNSERVRRCGTFAAT